jgi:hypothetical protein
MTSRNETASDREADRASSSSVDVVGITTVDRDKGGWQSLNGLDLELRLSKTDLLGQLLSLSSAVGKSLEDKLVGGNVDIV